MRTTLFNNCISNITAAVAAMSFLLFGSIKVPDDKPCNTANDKECCSGYSIDVSNLKRFMLDSLNGFQYEGGAYSKNDLLWSIQETPGDTLYLLNILTSQITDLVVTSPTAQGVNFVRLGRLGYCSPCPQRACCPRNVKAARIKRGSIRYQPR